MRLFVPVVLLGAIFSGCATTSNQQTATYAAPSGQPWAIALRQRGDSVDLLVNESEIATVDYSNGEAAAWGMYRGQYFSFLCESRDAECRVMAGGVVLPRAEARVGSL